MGKTWEYFIKNLSIWFLLAVLFVSAVPVSATETEDASSVSTAADAAIETEDTTPVNAGTVATAALDIVEVYTEINAEDVSSLENLQRDILNWMESYGSMSQEDQALLSESVNYMQAIAAEIEDLQDAANAVSRGGDIDLEEDGAENSWRYLNGEPINAYYKAILWGSQNKVTNGFSDGTFGINKNCTRGQIVTFLYRIR